jgi:hypothetical protein
MRRLLVLLHLAAFGLSSLLMLFQAYTHQLPTLAYYLALALFVAAIATSVALASEPLALVGVFSFFMVIRLMFYVSTLFLVFPFGDPYGQFGVLRAFAQSSHISVLYPGTPAFDKAQYLTGALNSYSQWPGLQILTLNLSRITSLPLLESAIALTLIFDVALFILAYSLIKKILQKTGLNLQNPIALCLAIVTSLASTEMPSYFKYDFPATLFLLASILLLLRIYDDHDSKVAVPLLILSVAITVTHSITSLFWVLILLPFALWSIVPGIVNRLPSNLRGFLRPLTQGPSHHRRSSQLPALFVFTVTSFVSWTTFYAVYLVKYSAVSLAKIFTSLSLGGSLTARVSPGQSGFADLTPKWMLDLLYVRDHVLLGLLVAGAVGFILLRGLFRRDHVKILILTVVLITVLTELSGALSFGDRAFLLFAPLLGVVYLVPLVGIGRLRPTFGKVAALLIIALFMFSAGIGFWASSYAPTGLYTQGADPSIASGRPLTWQAGASYLSFSGRQDCILTNEIYTTSLSVPIQEYNITWLVGNVPVRPKCLVIIYQGLFSAVNSNVSSFGFGEPYFPYTAFSPSAFYSGVSQKGDIIFSTGEETMYYYL